MRQGLHRPNRWRVACRGSFTLAAVTLYIFKRSVTAMNAARGTVADPRAIKVPEKAYGRPGVAMPTGVAPAGNAAPKETSSPVPAVIR